MRSEVDTAANGPGLSDVIAHSKQNGVTKDGTYLKYLSEIWQKIMENIRELITFEMKCRGIT